MARWAKRFVAFAGLDEEPAFRRSYTYYGEQDLSRLVAFDASDQIAEIFARHAEIYARGQNLDDVNRMCLADLHLFLPSLNLAYTDRASMMASTEVRVPFVDVRVAEAAFRCRGRQKIRGVSRKDVLKKAAEAWLPREIAYRPKALFSLPIRAWVRGAMDGFVMESLPDGRLVSAGILAREPLLKLIAANRDGVSDFSKEIWQLLTLEFWMRSYEGTAAVGAADPGLHS